MEFHIFSVIVDKGELYSRGFQFEGSFYKFLYNLLYKELYISFPVLKIQNHRLGGDEFMEGFIKYVEKKHITNLFSESEFAFQRSEDNRIIQLADAIGGLIGEKFDASIRSNDGDWLVELFKDHIIELKEWPVSFDLFQYTTSYKLNKKSKLKHQT